MNRNGLSRRSVLVILVVRAAAGQLQNSVPRAIVSSQTYIRKP